MPIWALVLGRLSVSLFHAHAHALPTTSVADLVDDEQQWRVVSHRLNHHDMVAASSSRVQNYASGGSRWNLWPRAVEPP